MSLWPKHKPLNQPKHYGRIGVRSGADDKPDPIAKQAHAAVRNAQLERKALTLRSGARATVR